MAYKRSEIAALFKSSFTILDQSPTAKSQDNASIPYARARVVGSLAPLVPLHHFTSCRQLPGEILQMHPQPTMLAFTLTMEQFQRLDRRPADQECPCRRTLLSPE